ncbi:hypothetical protein B5X24_HaOG205398 [Helicoverpa armigera]|nr:hypothetical protein B5X24_HaOG205398 [Helicoverpa armigera]
MVGSAESWDAVVSFCEEVMSQKESAERERDISRPQKAHRVDEKGGQRPLPSSLKWVRFPPLPNGPEAMAPVCVGACPCSDARGRRTPHYPVQETRPVRGPALVWDCERIWIPVARGTCKVGWRKNIDTDCVP